jgi:hypothetical protein
MSEENVDAGQENVDTGEQETQDNQTDQENHIESGVEDISADDLYKNTPVFDVNSNEFFSNMRKNRNRMRFSNGSKASKFMQSTKYRKPFYIRYTDGKGETYLTKVK